MPLNELELYPFLDSHHSTSRLCVRIRLPRRHSKPVYPLSARGISNAAFAALRLSASSSSPLRSKRYPPPQHHIHSTKKASQSGNGCSTRSLQNPNKTLAVGSAQEHVSRNTYFSRAWASEGTVDPFPLAYIFSHGLRTCQTTKADTTRDHGNMKLLVKRQYFALSLRTAYALLLLLIWQWASGHGARAQEQEHDYTVQVCARVESDRKRNIRRNGLTPLAGLTRRGCCRHGPHSPLWSLCERGVCPARILLSQLEDYKF